MYESQTFDVILQRMLDRVPDTVDKRVGSMVYDAIAPAAAELAQAYIEADTVLNVTYADTAPREYLIKRAAERNVIPEAATHSVIKGTFNVAVPIGNRFSLGELNYSVTALISGLDYQLTCETAGVAGNQVGTLVAIDYVDGLSSAVASEVLVVGQDEEATEIFRARYKATFTDVPFAGNKAYYRQVTNAIDGVGDTKVYRAWAGAGTVKLVIATSSFGVPSGTLVTTVQNLIDPTPGSGDGLAPIDHVVTVVGVASQAINIAYTGITYQSGANWASIASAVNAMLDAYLAELNATWADNTNLIVRVSQLETRLLNVAGVIDVTGVTINSVAANFTVPADSIATRGTVSGS